MTKAHRTRPGKRSLMLGVDAGGTFTDFVAYDGRGFRVHKVLSTPEAPECAILAGIEALGLCLWCAIAVTIDGFVESGLSVQVGHRVGRIDDSVVKYHDI